MDALNVDISPRTEFVASKMEISWPHFAIIVGAGKTPFNVVIHLWNLLRILFPG
jgi:hypothetical protein